MRDHRDSWRLISVLAGALMLLATAPPSSAAIRNVEVRPAIGGTQSTFTVVFRTTVNFGLYRVEVRPRCRGSATTYPWKQTIQLLGPPILLYRNAVQLPRPADGDGWCPGRFTGRIAQAVYRGPTTIKTKTLARFSFTVRRKVRTRLPEKPCRPRGSKTVARSSLARVYTTSYGGSIWTMGCLFTVRGHMQLSKVSWESLHEADVTALSMIRLAGPFVGYRVEGAGPVEVQWEIGATDLRTGDQVAYEYLPSSAVGAIVISPRTGMLAFTIRLDSGEIAVRRTTPGTQEFPGRGETLATGNDIDPRSLRLVGRKLTWTQAGVIRTAELP